MGMSRRHPQWSLSGQSPIKEDLFKRTSKEGQAVQTRACWESPEPLLEGSWRKGKAH